MKALTKHRKLVLKNLQDRRDHPTAKMVFDSTKDSSYKISFATVYNSLEYLVKTGFIKKLNIDSDSTRYDALIEPHSHLICTECGKITDIPPLRIVGEDGFENMNFLVEDININVLGKCKSNCFSDETNQKSPSLVHF